MPAQEREQCYVTPTGRSVHKRSHATRAERYRPYRLSLLSNLYDCTNVIVFNSLGKYILFRQTNLRNEKQFPQRQRNCFPRIMLASCLRHQLPSFANIRHLHPWEMELAIMILLPEVVKIIPPEVVWKCPRILPHTMHCRGNMRGVGHVTEAPSTHPPTFARRGRATVWQPSHNRDEPHAMQLRRGARSHLRPALSSWE